MSCISGGTTKCYDLLSENAKPAAAMVQEGAVRIGVAQVRRCGGREALSRCADHETLRKPYRRCRQVSEAESAPLPKSSEFPEVDRRLAVPMWPVADQSPRCRSPWPPAGSEVT